MKEQLQEITQLIKACQQYKAALHQNKQHKKKLFKASFKAIEALLPTLQEKQMRLQDELDEQVDEAVRANRKLYYDLQELVPKFLEQENKHYYYLQTYYVQCKNLLIIFFESPYPSDWPKTHVLSPWVAALSDAQDHMNAESSVERSLEEIKALYVKKDQLSQDEFAELQANVKNITLLLAKDPKLTGKIPAEDHALLLEVKAFIATYPSQDKIKEIPEALAPEPSETLAFKQLSIKMTQLIYFAEHLLDNYNPSRLISDVDAFQKNIKKKFFKKSPPILKIISQALLDAMGSRQQFTLKELVNLFAEVLTPFSDQAFLEKNYTKKEIKNHKNIIPHHEDEEQLSLIFTDLLEN